MQQAKYMHVLVCMQRYLYPLDLWPIVPLRLSSSNLDPTAPAYMTAAALCPLKRPLSGNPSHKELARFKPCHFIIRSSPLSQSDAILELPLS